MQQTEAITDAMAGAGTSDEARLIHRILAGEPEVFLDLIRPYERKAYCLAYSVLRNREDAEEAVQQAMLNVFRHLDSLLEKAKFKQWAMRIVENEARIVRRKRRQHLYESLDHTLTDHPDGTPQVRQFADWRELPSDVLERKELCAAVRGAVETLPETYRVVLVLRELQQMSVSETSAVMGISEGAVKTRTHRARLMLRDELTPLFADTRPSFWQRWRGLNPWSAAKR